MATSHPHALAPAGTVRAGLAVLPLLQTLREIAADLDLHDLLDLDVPHRQRFELRSTADLQVWLLAWPPGARTGWHDHGVALGAYATLRGTLTETSWEPSAVPGQGLPAAWLIGPGEARAYAAGHLHDVANLGAEPVLSVHAYAPRLTTMTRYERVTDHRGDRLTVVGVEQAEVG